MGLNLKRLIVAVVLGGVATSQAQVSGEYSQAKYLTLSKVKVREIKRDFFNQDVVESLSERDIKIQGSPNEFGMVDSTERVGKIISVSRDLVALGEDLYRLVIKGKPSNTTSYAPISVIPRIGGQPVDILDTERWTAPVKRTYEVVYENLYGIDVVTYRYSVIYSYNGSYNGTGAYLTAVQMIPEHVRTLFGFDFTATMKLGGIVNQGTKSFPIAGATLLMEYTVSSVMVSNNEVDTFFVNGRGGFKKY